MGLNGVVYKSPWLALTRLDAAAFGSAALLESGETLPDARRQLVVERERAGSIGSPAAFLLQDHREPES